MTTFGRGAILVAVGAAALVLVGCGGPKEVQFMFTGRTPMDGSEPRYEAHAFCPKHLPTPGATEIAMRDVDLSVGTDICSKCEDQEPLTGWDKTIACPYCAGLGKCPTCVLRDRKGECDECTGNKAVVIPCPTCDGVGKTGGDPCALCFARGCIDCRYTGKVRADICLECSGSRRQVAPGAQCPLCKGSGACPTCKGTYQCGFCRGKGQIKPLEHKDIFAGGAFGAPEAPPEEPAPAAPAAPEGGTPDAPIAPEEGTPPAEGGG